jgi:hypothetical protein
VTRNPHLAYGYVAARPFAPTAWFEDARLPERVVTVSHHLTAVGPGPWAQAWVERSDTDRRRAAEELGVAPASLPELHLWMADAMERGDWRWPRWFTTSRSAAAFVERFCAADDVRVVGVGPPEPLTSELGLDRPLDPGGEVLGHEILGVDHGELCSWHCNNLAPLVRRELGIRVNGHGLIDDAGQAAAAAELVARPEVGAEPVRWFPAVLVAYSTVTGGS